MNSIFIGSILLLATLRLFDPGPGWQLIFDALVAAGLLLLPLFWRRRPQGAEFLTTPPSSEGDSIQPDVTDLHGAGARSRMVRLGFLLWAVALAILYGYSLWGSVHSGYSFQALRQVLTGVVLFGLVISMRLGSESSLDVLLGGGWVLWLGLYLAPMWGDYLPALARIPKSISWQLPALSGEGGVFAPAWGVVGLEVWLFSTVLMAKNPRKRLLALAGHGVLWSLWGVIGGIELPLIGGMAALVTVAVGRCRPERFWLWAMAGLAAAAGLWWSARTYCEYIVPFKAGWWNPLRLAQQSDFQAALFRFPEGVGALGHEWIQPVFVAQGLAQPAPGGQQLIWLADLGIAGPILSLLLLGLLLAGIRFTGYAYPPPLEASRDPKALSAVRESEYPLAPTILPATLLAWLAATLVAVDLDLYRGPLFWLYLGLWAAWLAGKPMPLDVTLRRWRMALRAGLVGLAVLFLLAVGSRELGRRYYMRALEFKDGDERDVALGAAQYWDRWNPDYSIQMAEHALARGRQSPGAIQHGLLLTDRAIEHAPAHAEGYMLRSRFLRAGGQVFSALTAAEKAVFFAPRRADFRWELGGLYESVGRLDAARAEYASVLNLEPRNVDALMALARVEEKNRRYPEALEAYRRVLTLDRSRQSALIRYESLRERMDEGML